MRERVLISTPFMSDTTIASGGISSRMMRRFSRSDWLGTLR